MAIINKKINKIFTQLSISHSSYISRKTFFSNNINSKEEIKQKVLILILIQILIIIIM